MILYDLRYGILLVHQHKTSKEQGTICLYVMVYLLESMNEYDLIKDLSHFNNCMFVTFDAQT